MKKNTVKQIMKKMISCIDEWIGKFIDQCNLDNTLIVITSDHGDYIPIVDYVGEIPSIQSFMKKIKEKIPILEPMA